MSTRRNDSSASQLVTIPSKLGISVLFDSGPAERTRLGGLLDLDDRKGFLVIGVTSALGDVSPGVVPVAGDSEMELLAMGEASQPAARCAAEHVEVRPAVVEGSEAAAGTGAADEFRDRLQPSHRAQMVEAVEIGRRAAAHYIFGGERHLAACGRALQQTLALTINIFGNCQAQTMTTNWRMRAFFLKKKRK